MKLTSLKEDQDIEKRISITPETAKKYTSIGFEVFRPKNYGASLGFDDNQYTSQGVKIFESEKDLVENADIIVQLGLPSDDKLSLLRENQNLIGVLNPFANKEKLENLLKKKSK